MVIEYKRTLESKDFRLNIPSESHAATGDIERELSPGPAVTRYLTYVSPDEESEFVSYFIQKNIPGWKKTNGLIFIILSCLYLYLIAKNSTDNGIWKLNYSTDAKSKFNATNLSAGNFNGWYLRPCDPSMICNNYNSLYDATFWLITVLLPYITFLILSFQLKPQILANNMEKMTVIMAFVQLLCGVGVRFYIIENMQNFFQPTIIIVILMNIYFMGSRTRFLYSLPAILTISFIWIIMCVVAISIDTTIQNSGGDYGVGLICFAFGSIVTIVNSYEVDKSHRNIFHSARENKRTTQKLYKQLQSLRKDHHEKTEELLNPNESPLEKSINLVRNVMADSTLTSKNLLMLGQVTTLLTSSNILTPDFEGAAATSEMDIEQQAWLFSEIAARRRNGRGKLNSKHKQSISPESAAGGKFHKELNTVEEEMSPSRLSRTTHRISKIHEDPRAAFPPEIESIAQILNRCDEYDLNLFDLARVSGNRSLYLLSHQIFSKANLFESFSIPIEKFSNCMKTLESGYHQELPYHNSMHASDVLHCMYYLSNYGEIRDIVLENELLAMLFAAIIHDHDHPGLTNNFLIATSDPKATMYNDKAVLENHHCASSFMVLAKPENNFLSHLSKPDFKHFREIVVDLVLATDMTQHFTVLSMFKSKVASPEAYDPYDTRDDRMLLYKILMKCSDVSNPTKDLSIYLPWTRLIMSEFMSQGDQEKKLGIPVSPYMDRDNQNVPSCQTGFIDYVVQPLFLALDTYQSIPNILNQLSKNREYWGNLKADGITHIPDEKQILINNGTQNKVHGNSSADAQLSKGIIIEENES